MPTIGPNPPNEPRIIACATWEDFGAAVRTEYAIDHSAIRRTANPFMIFRGHARPEWKLSSPYERRLLYTFPDPDGTTRDHSRRQDWGLDLYDRYCTTILERFRSLSHGLPGVRPQMTDDELWSVGRHYGLITPLLDWTESPYVAAFFAFEERLKEFEVQRTGGIIKGAHGCVRVWGIRFWEPLVVPGEFELVTTRPWLAPRQRAQSGLFTRLWVRDHLDIESYLRSRNLAYCMEAYDIALDASVDGLRALQLMNITYATLFPDLSGAALQANVDSDTVRFAKFAQQDL